MKNVFSILKLLPFIQPVDTIKPRDSDNDDTVTREELMTLFSDDLGQMRLH